MRYLTGIVILMAASAACSNGPDRKVAASPTSPTAAVSGDSTISFAGGVSGPMDVLFPGRNESFLFRNDLETKYQTGLNRGASTTYVDREGEVVWTQEYMRYRVNGCDHATAVARVMTQIDGGVAGGICSAPAEGVVIFPSRADSLLFRQALETKYQQLGRALGQSFVDLEGGVIWTQEYLRYRANSCDHATGESKVFTQIDGGAVPDVCFVPCTLSVNPSTINIDSSPASGSFEVRPNRAGCNIPWTSTIDQTWLTTTGSFASGTGFTSPINYSVTRNSNTASRVAKMTFTWTGGSTSFVVNQAGSPFAASFTMTDTFRAGAASVTECHIKSSSTPCVFTATANLPGGGAYTYNWSASYFYGSQKSPTQNSTSNSFTINEACGGTGSQATGTLADLVITLTITDSLGNTLTIRSNDGSQLALAMKFFTC